MTAIQTRQRILLSAIAILAILSLSLAAPLARAAEDSVSLTGASSSSSQPADILINMVVSAITQISLLDKGATFELSNVVADASGEDGIPGEADGALDWAVYTSDALAAPGIKWDEDLTNTNAYFRVSALSHATVSVTVHGSALTLTPDDWIFFKDVSSTATPYYYGPRTYSVTLGAPGATITEPSGVTATKEGSLTLRILKYDGANWSIDTVTIALVSDETADKLYIDDDLNMTETTDTSAGLTKIEDDTTANGGDTYAQGDFLVKGSEITVRGINYVLETDMTGTGITTAILTIGYFSGYDQTQGSDVVEFYVAVMVPTTMPSGQSLSYDETIQGLEHANVP